MRKPRSFAILHLAVIAAGAALVAGAAAAQPGTSEIVAYRGATLIDGLGGVARPGMVVVVKGQRIVGVTPVADFDRTPAADARVVDSTGLYVLPGLIDSHVHLATVPNRARAEATLRRQLYSGVTAVRDMAGDGRALADLSRSALLGELAAPDIRYAALMAGPGFFEDPRPRATARGATAGDAPWMQAVTATTDLPRAIARAEGTWAAGIKIYSDVPSQLLAPIVAESHRQGLQVWSHGAIFPSRPSEVIAAGVDAISHACVLDYEFARVMPARYASEPTATFTASATDFAPLFAEMRRRNVILDATLFAYGQRGFDAAGSPNRVLACDDSRASQITGWAWRAGVAIAAGTDGETPADSAFPALHEELERLVAAGLPPIEALRAASWNGARAIGQAEDRGTIEVGKLADLVFTRDDPSRDIRALRSVVLTVKRGAQYPRVDFAR